MGEAKPTPEENSEAAQPEEGSPSHQPREASQRGSEGDPDLRMLREFFEAMEIRVKAYGGFLETIIQLELEAAFSALSYEDEFSRCEAFIERMKAWTIPEEYLRTIPPFLDEVRLERNLGLATLADRTASSACQLAEKAIREARVFWHNLHGLGPPPHAVLYREGGLPAWAPFKQYAMPHLPCPTDLLALLNQERAAARLVVEERDQRTGNQCESSRNTTTSIQHADIQIKSGKVTVESDVAKDASEANEPVIAVGTWANLSLGISETRDILAFSERFETGSSIAKTKGVVTGLSGDRWLELLNLLADSKDGQTVKADSVMHAFGYPLPPRPPGRGHPSPDENARGSLTDEHVQLLQVGARKLGDAIRDLNRDLRKCIAGPREPKNTGLTYDRSSGNVCARFITRYLLPNESGQYFFGEVGD